MISDEMVRECAFALRATRYASSKAIVDRTIPPSDQELRDTRAVLEAAAPSAGKVSREKLETATRALIHHQEYYPTRNYPNARAATLDVIRALGLEVKDD